MRRWTLLALSAAAVLGGGAWVYWKNTRPPPAPAQLNVYLTCDTSGRIEPCGCFTGQFGGLTRVQTVLQSAPASAIKLDAGDALAGPEDYHLLQFKHLLGAMGRIGYSAVNLGRRESRLSAATLRDLMASSPVPLVSANVIDAAIGEALVRPWVLVEREGVNVAVTGVVDPDKLQGAPHPSVKVAGMTESLRRVIPEMKARASVLICLAFTDEAGMEQLAREFYELHFILGGDVRQPSAGVTKVNRSHLLATTNQSRALGEVHAVWDPVSRQLTNVTGDISLMRDDIPQDEEIAGFSAAYRKEVRRAKLSVDDDPANSPDRVPGVKPPATFAGSEACAACHQQAYAAWLKSRHANGFASLVRKDSDADPSCIGCHVVGFREPGGYHRSMKAERLVHVGCESCHGPGSEHIRLRSTTLPGQEVLVKMRPVGQGQCVQCHHGEFSRPFKWDEFWPVIQHGKEQHQNR